MRKQFVAPVSTPNRRLDAWKEIAAFFGRDERTVKRWEKERGLPVHRLPGTNKGGVYAYANELSNWLKPPDSPAADPIVPAVASPAAPVPRIRWISVAALASVALAVVAITLNYPPVGRRAAAHAASAEAEDLYLKGRFHWNKRTPDDLNQAVDLFTQAIVRDPGYAKAYAGLADTYNLLREFSSMPSRDAFSRSLVAARRAVELDDGLADAHNSLAFVSFYGAWDFALAEHEFRRAIELDPKYATAFHWYANALLAQGRLDEAVARISRARELDPNSVSILADRAFILYFAGRQADGIALLKQVGADDPSFQSPHAYLAQIYMLRAEYPKYLAEAKLRARLAHDEDGMAVVAAGEEGLAEGGPRGLLETTLQVQEALYADERLPAFILARTCALLGRRAETMEYLHAALDKHEIYMVALATDPAFASLHRDAGFTRLLVEVRAREPHSIDGLTSSTGIR